MEMSRKDVGRDREVCVEFGWQEKRTKIGWEVRLRETNDSSSSKRNFVITLFFSGTEGRKRKIFKRIA